jgi:hypothetical protein
MAQPSSQTANFNAGDSISSSIDCTVYSPQYIIIPANWTSACLSFQFSIDNVTFADLHDVLGNLMTINARAGAAILVGADIGGTSGKAYIKFVSGGVRNQVPQLQACGIIVEMQ